MARIQSVRRSTQLDKELANTRFERILQNASQLSLVAIAAFVVLLTLQLGQFILAPIFLAMTIGLMCGPVADRLERTGIGSGLSAAVVVLSLLAFIGLGAYLFAQPLSVWIGKVPMIWEKLQAELVTLRGPLEAVGALEAQVRSIFGSDAAMTVTVADGGPVTSIAFLAPAVVGQLVIFFAGLYFFLAARHSIRIGVLSLTFTRKLRWRTAHVFRDVEQRVSKYLLTITLVNLGLGALVAVAMAIAGMPSPLLWGALAFVLNFIPFLGQAFMLVLIFLIGLGTRDGLTQALLPVALYWGLSFAESQVVTPNLLGRTMTINPFLIFLSLTFWLWAWGPVGGLIAVPSVLILHSIVTHILPTRAVVSTRASRRLDARATLDVREAEPISTPPKPTAAEIAPRKSPPRKRGPRKAAIAPSA